MFSSLHPELQSPFAELVKKAIVPLFRSTFSGDNLITLDKSAGFTREPAFSAVFDAHAHTEEDRSRSWRLHTLTWAAQAALSLEGDFVECGVYEGFMSAVVIDW